MLASFVICLVLCSLPFRDFFFRKLDPARPRAYVSIFQVRLMICFRTKSSGKPCDWPAAWQRAASGIPADKGLSGDEVLPYPLCLKGKCQKML